jgi:hypothetical protein
MVIMMNHHALSRGDKKVSLTIANSFRKGVIDKRHHKLQYLRGIQIKIILLKRGKV